MASNVSLDSFLQVDSDGFTPPMANAVIHFQVTDEVQSRVTELGDKANEGTLTDQERAEYEKIIEWAEMLSLMKLRARKFLKTLS